MIASSRYISSLLESEGLKPNKNLGQNFFINGAFLSELVFNIPLRGKTVLEIGPGLGALTEILLSYGANVIAVEKDPNMVRLLNKALSSPRLTVIEGDILRFPIETIKRPFTAAGNLPYCITADIIAYLYKLQPEQMILMLQKEAADRFFSLPSQKNYMPLTAACSLFYSIEKLSDVPSDYYYPSPNVTSSIVYLKKRMDSPAESPDDLLAFFMHCFRMRRKTLLNNLSCFPHVKEVLDSLGLNYSIRAEALSPEQLLALYRSLSNT